MQRQVAYATVPGDPGIANEDFVAATPSAAVVLDGVTPMDRSDTGCRHGVAWYARTLGSDLFALATTTGSQPRSLVDCLAEAIGRTRDAHSGSCDLAHPDSPAATVAVVRMDGERIDYLVLSDAAVVLDLGTRVREVSDHRAGQVSQRLRASGVRPTAPVVRAQRNQPAGYWVAAERPEAAYEALTGTVAATEVRRLMLASDGATRLVDTFGLYDWPGALDALQSEGPDAWLERTRVAERADAADPAPRVRRAKVHDDATVVFFGGATPALGWTSPGASDTSG
jgi:hypothetical protein